MAANTGHSPNAVLRLSQRRKRLTDIKAALGECPVFAGIHPLTRVWIHCGLRGKIGFTYSPGGSSEAALFSLKHFCSL